MQGFSVFDMVLKYGNSEVNNNIYGTYWVTSNNIKTGFAKRIHQLDN